MGFTSFQHDLPSKLTITVMGSGLRHQSKLPRKSPIFNVLLLKCL